MIGAGITTLHDTIARFSTPGEIDLQDSHVRPPAFVSFDRVHDDDSLQVRTFMTVAIMHVLND